MTRGIIFYDEEYEEECMAFCRERNISYLPDIYNANKCYFFNVKTERFEPRGINPDKQTVDPDGGLFRPEIIEQFKKHEVLFVKNHDVIHGVVHYSDYNHPKVYEEIYKQLFLLEKGLIKLIIENAQLMKKDLTDFMGKDPGTNSTRLLEERDFSGAEKVNLKVILEFTRAHQLVRIREEDIHKIVLIRNIIAHSDYLVSRDKKDSRKYNAGAFSRMIRGVNALHVVIRQVANRIYFMQAILKDDFSVHAYTLEEYLN